MNERIQKLALQAGATWNEGYIEQPNGDSEWSDRAWIDHNFMNLEMFAKLIVQECVNTLEFHGFDDAVPHIKWMATNKLGVEE